MLNPERQSRHQAADDNERRGKDHASLSRPPVRDEPQQQDAEDLPDDQGVGDPRLVVRRVVLAEHVREDKVHGGGDLLLIAIGEVGCSLNDGESSVLFQMDSLWWRNQVCPWGLTQPATAKIDVVRQLLRSLSDIPLDGDSYSSGTPATLPEVCFSLRSAAGAGSSCTNTAICGGDDILG